MPSNLGGIVWLFSSLQLEAVPFTSWLRLYGSLEYLQKSGRSLNGHQKTSIWQVPLSLGFQPIFRIPACQSCYAHFVYFTLGPRYVFTTAHNHSAFVPKKMNANGLGFFANAGLLFEIYPHLFIDLFAEYSNVKLAFHTKSLAAQGHVAQVGGLCFGAGIGYAF